MSAESHDLCHCLPDPLGGGLDLVVSEMGVAQRHADVGVTEHPRDDRHRDAVHHRVAGKGMTEVVKADILDAGFAADPVPERKIGTEGSIRIARRREHEGTCVSRLPFEDAPGLAVEGDLSRARLAVGWKNYDPK